MGRGIGKRTIIMLPVNFNEACADEAQGLHTDRLVVDKGARFAVGHLHAPQNDLALVINRLAGEQLKDRMIVLGMKDRCHLPLRFTLTYERAITARAKREGEGIKQDRFARPRLTGQNGKAVIKGQIEAINQNNIANGQMRQHRRMKRWSPIGMQAPLKGSSPP